MSGLKIGKFVRAYFIILVILVFFSKGVVFLDPDFGWRLRTGILILKNGIPQTDPFSYTMSSFPFVDHAWLTDVGIALAYPSVGMLGLSLIGVCLIFLSLLISLLRTGIKKDKLRIVFPASLLSVSAVLPFFGVRVQVVTWFMFSILLFLVCKSNIWKKWKLITPVFFIIWTNLHGGYAAGLLALFIIIIFRFVRKRQVDRTDVLVLFLSLVFTLINPYGFGDWREVWSSVSDSKLRWRINEWMPSVISFNLGFISMMVLSSVLIFVYRSKIKLEELVLYFTFLLQAVSSMRHIPLWVIVSLPLLIDVVRIFFKDISTNKISVQRFNKAVRVLLYFSMLVFVFQSFQSFRFMKGLKEGMFYPKGAVNYLASNLPEGQIFSRYGWGGYLIWKLPEKKVFIDGRMPSWRRSSAPSNETKAVIDDYFNILKGDLDYKEVFNKYGIDTVLWPVEKPPSPWSRFERRLIKLIIKDDKQSFSLSKSLLDDGWQVIYEDSASVIYKKQ
jgi:hypothetical protein